MRSLACTVLLIMTITITVGAQETLPLIFEPSETDLGSIAPGRLIPYTLSLTNPTSAEITLQLLATCGCLKEGSGRYTLAAGEELTIELLFDSAGMHSGEFEKYFIVRLSGGAAGKAYYFVTGRVE